MLTRLATAVLLFQISVAPIAATATPRNPGPEREFSGSELAHRLVGKNAALRVGASAVWGQVWNRPREWGRGFGGFGKRAASAMGGHLVGSSIHYTVATLRHEEFGYHRSEKQGFKPRLTHALLATVITRKTTSGKNTVATGKISGTVGSAMISRLWQPMRLRTVSSGFASAGTSLGIDAGTNVVREFWPEIRHPRRRGPRKVGPAVAADQVPPATAKN